MVLNNQLDTYVLDVHSNIEFSELKGIGGLAKKKKMRYCVPIDVFACKIAIDFTYMDCNCIKGCFSNENHKESIV